MGRIKFEGSGYAHGPCLGDIEVVASVVLFSRPTVPGIKSPQSPQCKCEGRGVNNCSRSGRSHWVRIPIIFFTMELFIGGDFRVDARTAEDIAGDHRLVREVVP